MSLHPSKSTKRRRFLKEIEVTDVYIESSNHNFVHSDNDILLESQDTVDNLIVPCNSVVNNISDSIEPKSSLINVSKEVKHLLCNNLSSLETVEDVFMLNVSSSDTDDESKTISAEYLSDDRNPILQMLGSWAVSYNITNVAFSGLLKTLKKHKCFNFFPVDARTVLKTKNIDDKQIQDITNSRFKNCYWY